MTTLTSTTEAPTIALDALPARRFGLLCEELDGECVLYDHAHHYVHYLNATAYFIWTQCDGQTTVRDIVAKLVSEFEMGRHPDGQDLASHAAATLASLEESGAIDLTLCYPFTGATPWQE